eukprot:1019302-Alexandrium_andersonii.AAC.1
MVHQLSTADLRYRSPWCASSSWASIGVPSPTWIAASPSSRVSARSTLVAGSSSGSSSGRVKPRAGGHGCRWTAGRTWK